MRGSTDLISDYIQKQLPPRSTTLQRIEAALRADGKWGINIGAGEGHLLQFLIRVHQVKDILEIGTQYGYSTQWMLEALPQEGSVITLEKDPEHHKKAQELIDDSRVRFLKGNALELLKTLETKFFDLIFIDANKKGYPEYLTWAETHVRPGGLIIGDNTFLFGQVLQEEPQDSQQKGLWLAMREFNERLFKNPHFQTCLIPTSEGLTVAIRKEST